jgi:hypothetical protein
VAAWVAGSRAPQRDLTEGSPEFVFLAFRGLNQLVFGSRGYYASRVIHQRVETGSGMLGAAVSMAVAALGGGPRRRRGFQAVPVRENGCTGLVERAQGKGNPLPGLCGAEIGCSTPATAGLRLCGGGAPVNGVPAIFVGYSLQELA